MSATLGSWPHQSAISIRKVIKGKARRVEFVALIVVSWSTLHEIVRYKIGIYSTKNLDTKESTKELQRLGNNYDSIRKLVIEDKLQQTSEKKITW